MVYNLLQFRSSVVLCAICSVIEISDITTLLHHNYYCCSQYIAEHVSLTLKMLTLTLVDERKNKKCVKNLCVFLIICVCIYVCGYICALVCVYMCMHVCVLTCVCVCVCLYACVTVCNEMCMHWLL